MWCGKCGLETMEISAGSTCPACGSFVRTGGTGSHSFDAPVPWESEAAGRRPLMALALTLVRSFSSPGRFFTAAAANRPLLPAFIYGLVLGSVGMVGPLFWKSFFSFSFLSIFSGSNPLYMTESSSSAAQLMATPLYVLLQLLFFSVCMHAALVVTRSRKQGPGATFKVICYAQGALLFQAVPIIGGLLSFFAWLYLAVAGIRAVNCLSRTRVFFIFVMPLLIIGLTFAGLLALCALTVMLANGHQFDIWSILGR